MLYTDKVEKAISKDASQSTWTPKVHIAGYLKMNLVKGINLGFHLWLPYQLSSPRSKTHASSSFHSFKANDPPTADLEHSVTQNGLSCKIPLDALERYITSTSRIFLELGLIGPNKRKRSHAATEYMSAV